MCRFSLCPLIASSLPSRQDTQSVSPMCCSHQGTDEPPVGPASTQQQQCISSCGLESQTGTQGSPGHHRQRCRLVLTSLCGCLRPPCWTCPHCARHLLTTLNSESHLLSFGAVLSTVFCCFRELPMKPQQCSRGSEREQGSDLGGGSLPSEHDSVARGAS